MADTPPKQLLNIFYLVGQFVHQYLLFDVFFSTWFVANITPKKPRFFSEKVQKRAGRRWSSSGGGPLCGFEFF